MSYMLDCKHIAAVYHLNLPISYEHSLQIRLFSVAETLDSLI
jgi:hypothetical protein